LRSEFPQRFGAYVLLAPFGEGGMGTVYLAMSGHRDMETLCVVKRLLPELLSHPDHVRGFRQEADLARRLGHSNLAHTHNVGEVKGEVFLVQEFVEGHDVSALLDELRRQKRALPVPVAVHIASEIAQGLSYAHDFEKLGLVHRDINPPNIRVTYSGEVKLLDFGIAASILHGGAQGEQRGAGKLWHLAPEQVRPGGTVDRRTDIYALGVVLWELLTQRPVGTVRAGDREVRQPETEAEVLVWITRSEHQPPSVFNPEVPPELDALVVKATHANPDYRHANAEDLRCELASFIPPGFHPEPHLAALMKELFSPDAERAARRRTIESARHLLEVSGPRRAGRRASDSQTAEMVRRGAAVRSWLPWLVAVAVAGLVLWFVSRPRESREGPDRAAQSSPVASAPAAPQVAGSAAPSASVARQVEPARAPSPPPPTVMVRTPAPAPEANRGAAPSASAAPAVAAASTVPVSPDAKPAHGAAGPAKIDHLQLARNAFNERDLPRALGEGKLAVAAGAGAEAHALLGNTYFKMGRFVEAEQAYTKAVALAPSDSLLQERLRIAHVRAQDGTGGEKN
jgi:serine/threonine protein kinase